MAAGVVTSSMRARATVLLEGSKSWTRGRRKSDGMAFVLFPSSRPNHAYYVRVDGAVCSCSGFLYRGICSHSIAVREDFERAQDAAARPTVRYEDLIENEGWF